MSKTSRALRRHHRVRMLNRALKSFKWEDDPDYQLWRARRSFNNMAICSCWMCKNERRNGWNANFTKLTMQERRAFLRYQYELKELHTSSMISEISE